MFTRNFVVNNLSQLIELPVHIRNLNALVHLKVSQNVLTHLPHNIKSLQNLKVLDVAKNHLSYLPVTITYLRLQLLDVTENPFTNDTKNYVHSNENVTSIRVPSLVECSAKSILKFRFLLFLFSFYLYCIVKCSRYATCESS